MTKTDLFDDEIIEPEKPEKPNDIDRLVAIIENRQASNCGDPRGMPTNPQQAAHWWIKFLEPRLQHEIDMKTKKGWHLPYQERLADCLKIFYRMRHSEQAELVAMRGRGIQWRGDSIEFMRIRQKVDVNKIDKAGMLKLAKRLVSGSNVPRETNA